MKEPNMRWSIAVVEDTLETRNQIVSFIERFEQEANESFLVHIFQDGDEIIDEYVPKYDIIFLDIEMKRLDGMKTAEKIRALDKDVILIFITNMSNYAVKGYQVDALSFLLKPLPYFAFSVELKKSVERLKNKKQNFVIIPTQKGIEKVNTSDILYIESIKHQLVFVTKDKTYTMVGTLKDMEKKLKVHHFFRSNSCYLVNLATVTGVEENNLRINEHELRISRPRKKDLMKALTDYIGGNIK